MYAHCRMALSLQRRCTRFFDAIWLRHRSNSGFAGTEPDEAPFARTGIITHDGNNSVNEFGTGCQASHKCCHERGTVNRAWQVKPHS